MESYEIVELEKFYGNSSGGVNNYVPNWFNADNHTVTYTILGGSESAPDIPSYYDNFSDTHFGALSEDDERPQIGQQAIYQESILAG